MILQLALLGDVFNDNLVTFLLALSADLASAEPNLQRRTVFSFPVNFQANTTILAIFSGRESQQLLSFGGIAKDLTHVVSYHELLSGRISQHGDKRLIHV